MINLRVRDFWSCAIRDCFLASEMERRKLLLEIVLPLRCAWHLWKAKTIPAMNPPTKKAKDAPAMTVMSGVEGVIVQFKFGFESAPRTGAEGRRAKSRHTDAKLCRRTLPAALWRRQSARQRLVAGISRCSRLQAGEAPRREAPPGLIPWRETLPAKLWRAT